MRRRAPERATGGAGAPESDAGVGGGSGASHTAGPLTLVAEPDFVSVLPDDILTTLFTFLDVPSLLRVSMTARRFGRVLSPAAWRMVFERRWGAALNLDKETTVSEGVAMGPAAPFREFWTIVERSFTGSVAAPRHPVLSWGLARRRALHQLPGGDVAGVGGLGRAAEREVLLDQASAGVAVRNPVGPGVVGAAGAGAEAAQGGVRVVGDIESALLARTAAQGGPAGGPGAVVVARDGDGAAAPRTMDGTRTGAGAAGRRMQPHDPVADLRRGLVMPVDGRGIGPDGRPLPPGVVALPEMADEGMTVGLFDAARAAARALCEETGRRVCNGCRSGLRTVGNALQLLPRGSRARSERAVPRRPPLAAQVNRWPGTDGPSVTPWKLACVLHERGDANVLRCTVCNEVDMVTDKMLVWESLPTQAGCSVWVVPCRCGTVAHRRCLETLVAKQLAEVAEGASKVQAELLGEVEGDAGADVNGSVGVRVDSDDEADAETKVGREVGGAAADRSPSAPRGTPSAGARRGRRRQRRPATEGDAVATLGTLDVEVQSAYRRWRQRAFSVDELQSRAEAGAREGVRIEDDSSSGGSEEKRSDATGSQNGGSITGVVDDADTDALPAAELVAMQAAAVGRCPHCKTKYRRGWRLPRSLPELLMVSARDHTAWQRLCLSLLWWALACLVTAVLEGFSAADGSPMCTTLNEYRLSFCWPYAGARGGVLAWWLLWQVVLIAILVSRRFTRVVDRLFHGPLFHFYLRLYVYFVVACILTVAAFTPVLHRVLPTTFEPELPLWMMVIGWANIITYMPVASVIIFMFWKTNYRVSTVGDYVWRGTNLADGQHPILAV